VGILVIPLPMLMMIMLRQYLTQKEKDLLKNTFVERSIIAQVVVIKKECVAWFTKR